MIITAKTPLSDIFTMPATNTEVTLGAGMTTLQMDALNIKDHLKTFILTNDTPLMVIKDKWPASLCSVQVPAKFPDELRDIILAKGLNLDITETKECYSLKRVYQELSSQEKNINDKKIKWFSPLSSAFFKNASSSPEANDQGVRELSEVAAKLSCTS